LYKSEKNLVFAQTFKNQLVGADSYYKETTKSIVSSKIEGIQILDDYTISFSLLKPNYAFLSILATPSLSIFPKEAIDTYGENSRVGSGAFKIVSNLDLKNEFILVRNPTYYRKDSLGNSLPFLDSISFYVSTSKRYEMDEFKKRNLEMVWGIPKESIDALVQGDLKKFENDSIYRLKLIPEYTTQFYTFNLKTKIFQNENVRKAISAAIDKNKIVEDVLKGEAFASGTFGITPPSMKYYEANKIIGDRIQP
jgi:oligopeptide transport system substrate-binding protein